MDMKLLWKSCASAGRGWYRSAALKSNQEINSEYSLEGLMLKLTLHYFGHLMQN